MIKRSVTHGLKTYYFFSWFRFWQS